MNDDIMDALSADRGTESLIMVVGVGGAGGNAVRHMYQQGIEGVEFMVCNTDKQPLDKSPIENKVQLGSDGLGAGNNPEVGRLAAIESLDAIKSKLKAADTKMLFITAGMGGGTGTGASPVIAKMAKEEGILTVAIVTSPLSVEGNERFSQAVDGIQKLRQYVDSLLIINNDNIVSQFPDLALTDAFGKADDILCSAAKGIAEIITVKSDHVNVDFADVKKVMSGSGTAHMSVVSAEGQDRAAVAARESLTSPLLDQNLISGAKNILVNFVTSEAHTLSVSELGVVLNYIQSHATVEDPETKKRQTANIIWGTSIKPNLDKKLELVVVATGFNGSKLEAVEYLERTRDEIEGVVPANQVEEAKAEETEQVAPEVKVETPTLVPQTKPVVLGTRKSKYANIEQITKEPAYKTRKVELIVASQNARKEVFNKENTSDVGVDSSLFKL